MNIELNIPESQVEELSNKELAQHIAAIRGGAVPTVKNRPACLRTLARLRQWSVNEDGMLGVRKGQAPQVRSLAELTEKAQARGKPAPVPPAPQDKIVPVPVEWEDDAPTGESMTVDGMEVVKFESVFDAIADTPKEAAELKASAEQRAALVERDPVDDLTQEMGPSTDDAAAWRMNGDGRQYPRGSMRERLAATAKASAPIEPKPVARKPTKKITGEARKPREMLLGVKATFAGATKNHKGGLREAALIFVQSHAEREIEGWPVGSVPVTEVDSHYDQNMKPILHKLLEDGHLVRVLPNALAPQMEAKQESETAA